MGLRWPNLASRGHSQPLAISGPRCLFPLSPHHPLAHQPMPSFPPPIAVAPLLPLPVPVAATGKKARLGFVIAIALSLSAIARSHPLLVLDATAGRSASALSLLGWAPPLAIWEMSGAEEATSTSGVDTSSSGAHLGRPTQRAERRGRCNGEGGRVRWRGRLDSARLSRRTRPARSESIIAIAICRPSSPSSSTGEDKEGLGERGRQMRKKKWL